MANVCEPDFDETRDRDGFRSRRARIGWQAGSEKLGASLWEVPPGEAAYPYHWHWVHEELVVVIEGSLSLRTPDGWRELERGEVVSFRVGEEGAHQLVNRGEQPASFLSLSTGGMPDVCVYPDSDKIGVYENPSRGRGVRELHRRSEAVDYWDGEEPPDPR